MDPAFPVNDENDFARLGIHINNNFLNECAHEAFLQTEIRMRTPPDGLEVRGQTFECFSTWDHDLMAALHVLIDTRLDLADAL